MSRDLFFLLGVAGLFLASFHDLRAQDTLFRQMTTPERVKRNAWWPTKMLASRDDYVGPQVCASCHKEIAASQQNSEMARTLMAAAASPVLQTSHEFALGPYSYNIARQPNGVMMKVSNGSSSLAAPLTWAIGVGRTQVFTAAVLAVASCAGLL